MSNFTAYLLVITTSILVVVIAVSATLAAAVFLPFAVALITGVLAVAGAVTYFYKLANLLG